MISILVSIFLKYLDKTIHFMQFVINMGNQPLWIQHLIIKQTAGPQMLDHLTMFLKNYLRKTGEPKKQDFNLMIRAKLMIIQSREKESTVLVLPRIALCLMVQDGALRKIFTEINSEHLTGISLIKINPFIKFNQS